MLWVFTASKDPTKIDVDVGTCRKQILPPILS